METSNSNEQQGVLATPEDVQTVLGQLSQGTIVWFVLRLFEENQMISEKEAVAKLKKYLGITRQDSEAHNARRNTNERILRHGLQIKRTQTKEGMVWGLFLRERPQPVRPVKTDEPTQPDMGKVLDELVQGIRTQLDLEDTPENRETIEESITQELKKRATQPQAPGEPPLEQTSGSD